VPFLSGPGGRKGNQGKKKFANLMIEGLTVKILGGFNGVLKPSSPLGPLAGELGKRGNVKEPENKKVKKKRVGVGEKMTGKTAGPPRSMAPSLKIKP